VNVTVHPDRQGGRPAGKPLTGSAASLKDPATAVRAARALMLSGSWRTVPKTGDDTTKAEYTLRVHTPAALAVLPRSAIAGLTRRPPAGGCSWCTATFHAATSAGADPAPSATPTPRRSLGHSAAGAGWSSSKPRPAPPNGLPSTWRPASHRLLGRSAAASPTGARSSSFPGRS
jgi:hypothetical protein